MQPRILEEIPRFGWTLLDVADLRLTDDDPITTAIERPPGFFRGTIYAEIPIGDISGTGEVTLVLEGSNTGDELNPWEWDAIAELASDDYFVSPGSVIFDQRKMLGARVPPVGGMQGAGSVPVGRYQYLRVRTYVVREASGGTFVNPAAEITAPDGIISVWKTSGVGVGEGQISYPTIPVVPASFSISWTSGAVGYRQDDNGYGGFVGEGDHQNSTIDYDTGELVIDMGPYPPDVASSITIRWEQSSDPVTYNMNVRFVGHSGDGEKMTRDYDLVKLGGASIPAEGIVGESFRRPAGTRYMTVQALAEDVVLSPPASDGFQVSIEGVVSDRALNRGEWITVDESPSDEPLNADGEARFFEQGQAGVIDMGPFEHFRPVVRFEQAGPLGPSDDLTSGTVRFVFAFDDNDWLDGDIGISRLTETIRETFLQVAFSNEQGASPGPKTLIVQVKDMNGQPLNGQRIIGLVISDNRYDGLLAPSASANMSLFTDVVPISPTDLPVQVLYPSVGPPSPVIIVQTDISGQAWFTITGNPAQTYHLTAFNVIPDAELPSGSPLVGPGQEFGPGQVVISSDIYSIAT
jgi:hypothetical protein